jgi:hypothetical protein
MISVKSLRALGRRGESHCQREESLEAVRAEERRRQQAGTSALHYS